MADHPEPAPVKFGESAESKMVYSAANVAATPAKFVTVGNGPDISPGSRDAATALPCKVTTRVWDFNPTRGSGCHLHSLGHLLENYARDCAVPAFGKVALTFFNLDFRTRFGAAFNSFYDVCPYTNDVCIAWQANGTMPDLEAMSGTSSSQTFDFKDLSAGCGNVHFPANATTQYLCTGDVNVATSCENYGLHNGAGGKDLTTPYTNAMAASKYGEGTRQDNGFNNFANGVASDCGAEQPTYIFAQHARPRDHRHRRRRDGDAQLVGLSLLLIADSDVRESGLVGPERAGGAGGRRRRKRQQPAGTAPGLAVDGDGSAHRSNALGDRRQPMPRPEVVVTLSRVLNAGEKSAAVRSRCDSQGRPRCAAMRLTSRPVYASPVVGDLQDEPPLRDGGVEPQGRPRRLARLAALVRGLEAVIDGVPHQVDHVGPQRRPLLGVEPHAVGVDLDHHVALAQPLAELAGVLRQAAQRPLGRLEAKVDQRLQHGGAAERRCAAVVVEALDLGGVDLQHAGLRARPAARATVWLRVCQWLRTFPRLPSKRDGLRLLQLILGAMAELGQHLKIEHAGVPFQRVQQPPDPGPGRCSGA